jgi:NAD(P)H-dependent flavin oxidoreductase YrpB (nitropropane dioxygenase family)
LKELTIGSKPGCIITIMLRTALCDLLGMRFPVIQAGMGLYRGLVTTPELVAAVSQAGGFGCLGGTGLEPDELRNAIRRIRALTDRPFGVDLLLPARLSRREGTRDTIRAEIKSRYPAHEAFVAGLFTRYGIERTTIDMDYALTPELTDAQVEVVFEERVAMLVVGLGDPGPLTARAHDYGMLIAGLVGAPRHARRQAGVGVDIIIAQGAEAGGHVGTIATMPLVPQIVDCVAPIPVVAAGGIADGRGVAAGLMLGAQGVWCGTAFLFAEEAGLHPTHRAQMQQGGSEDFVPSRIYTGKTARTYRNEVHQLWAATGLEPLPMPHQKVLMDDFLDAARRAGCLEPVSNPCGQAAGFLQTVKPAAQILEELVHGAEAALSRGGTFIQ